MPVVSIIIPAYNAMKYLPETVETVLQQTFQDYDVIIVNDGSTDDVETWVANLNHPKIKLISQANQGLSGARNTGIQNAQGDYIALLDADDLWHPTKLEKQVQLLDRFANAGLVYTWTALMDESGRPTGRFFSAEDEGKVWKKLIEFNVVGCGSVPLIRRSCFDTVGLFDRNLRSFVEDWDLWLRMAPHFEFKVVKEPLVYYRQLPSSASRNWEAMAQSYQIVIEKNFSTAPDSMQYLKARSNGFMSLNLAWKPLQGHAPQPKVAAEFQRKAIAQYPKIILSKEFWKLTLLIVLNQWLGVKSYRYVLSLMYALRRRLIQVSQAN
ncbi:glycosyltransferase family 2 protein [Altericista sp. CCNU0014]|uniref:glycosyltransferase family 2 protein n=1 Tax=Altericista sp. CCNU0014 TaxID=3082949 RepID=UPI00384F1E5C